MKRDKIILCYEKDLIPLWRLQAAAQWGLAALSTSSPLDLAYSAITDRDACPVCGAKLRVIAIVI